MNKQQIKDYKDCTELSCVGMDKDCSSCSCNVCIAGQSEIMTPNEYQELALRTANTEDKQELIENGTLGLSGESGEIADILKKYKFQGHKLDKVHMAKELGDVLWYAAILAEGLEIDLETVMKDNIAKLENRYPNGFEAEKSINRVEE